MPPSTPQAAPSPKRPFPATPSRPTATRLSAPSPHTALSDSPPHTHTRPRVFDRFSTPVRPTASNTSTKRFRQASSSSPLSAPTTPATKRIRARAPPASPSPRSASARSTGGLLFAQRIPSPQPPKLLFSTRRSPSAFPAMFESLTERSFRGQVNFLSATVEVCFEGGGSVDMIGGGQTGTSYSLPGHVLLTLPSLPAELDGRIREIQSLVLRAEGKSEFHDDASRYTPVRLYENSVRLASPSAPLLIPAVDPSRGESRQMHVAIPFDLRLPGWLPPSHVTNLTNTSYGLRADIKIGWLDGAVKSSVRLAALSNPSLSPLATSKSSSPFTTFTVLRHRFPVDSDGHTTIRPERSYTLRPDCNKATPIECIVSVPDWVDVNGDEKSLRVSLRVRARPARSTALGLEVDTDTVDEEYPIARDREVVFRNGRTEPETGSQVLMERGNACSEVASAPAVTVCLSELGMEVEEVERFTTSVHPTFSSLFPLPEQPTGDYDFIAPRPVYAVSRLINETPFRGIRTRQCLLADDGKQRNFFFADDGLTLNHRWRKVNVVLPMPDICQDGSILPGGRPQPELEAPFLRIRHNLKIKMVVHSPESDAESVIILTTPIRFASSPSTLPGRPSDEARLPAYIQVFHENGDVRQCDPLPLYAARAGNACPAPAGEVLPPVPPYRSLYPEDPTLLRVPTPSASMESLRSLSPSSSSSADAADAMDIDTPSSFPGPADPTIKPCGLRPQLSGGFSP